MSCPGCQADTPGEWWCQDCLTDRVRGARMGLVTPFRPYRQLRYGEVDDVDDEAELERWRWRTRAISRGPRLPVRVHHCARCGVIGGTVAQPFYGDPERPRCLACWKASP